MKDKTDVRSLGLNVNKTEAATVNNDVTVTGVAEVSKVYNKLSTLAPGADVSLEVSVSAKLGVSVGIASNDVNN